MEPPLFSLTNVFGLVNLRNHHGCPLGRDYGGNLKENECHFLQCVIMIVGNYCTVYMNLKGTISVTLSENI